MNKQILKNIINEEFALIEQRKEDFSFQYKESCMLSWLDMVLYKIEQEVYK